MFRLSSLPFDTGKAYLLELPCMQSARKAVDYLKSLAGQAFIRKRFAYLSRPMPCYYESKRKNPVYCGQARRVGLIKNDDCLAYVLFEHTVLTIHYCEYYHRDFHGGYAGPNASKYRGPHADELGLIVKRYDERPAGYGPKKKGFEIFIDL